MWGFSISGFSFPGNILCQSFEISCLVSRFCFSIQFNVVFVVLGSLSSSSELLFSSTVIVFPSSSATHPADVVLNNFKKEFPQGYVKIWRPNFRLPLLTLHEYQGIGSASVESFQQNLKIVLLQIPNPHFPLKASKYSYLVSPTNMILIERRTPPLFPHLKYRQSIHTIHTIRPHVRFHVFVVSFGWVLFSFVCKVYKRLKRNGPIKNATTGRKGESGKFMCVWGKSNLTRNVAIFFASGGSPHYAQRPENKALHPSMGVTVRSVWNSTLEVSMFSVINVHKRPTMVPGPKECLDMECPDVYYSGWCSTCPSATHRRLFF